MQDHSTRFFDLSAGNHTLRSSSAPLKAPDLIETVQLWRSIFAHIRHLTICMAFGCGFTRRDGTNSCLKANHSLFSICAFIAFGPTTPSLEDVKILLDVRGKNTLDKIGSAKLQLCFWLLKLLVGKVPTIDHSALQRDPFTNTILGVNDVGDEMSRACARYVSAILATHLPVRKVAFKWIWQGKEELETESNLDLLREFISQDSATLLERFIDRVDVANGWNDGC